MRNTKTKEAAPETPVTVERPAEETAGRELRAAVETFNAEAPSRAALSTDDQQTLTTITSLAHEFLRVASKAWNTEVVSGCGKRPEMPADVPGVVAEVEAYVRATRAVKIETLEGLDEAIKSPAIQSESVRSVIAQRGAKIITLIDRSLQAAHDRDMRLSESQRLLHARVGYWLDQPSSRYLLLAFLALAEDNRTGNGEVMDVLRRFMAHDVRGQERSGNHPVYQPLPTAVGTWRAWIGVAKEILSQQNVSGAKAA